MLSLDVQQRTMIISHNASKIIVEFSLIEHFQDFIGEIYEICGTLETSKFSNVLKCDENEIIFCSAVLITIIQGANMQLIQSSASIINSHLYPHYKNIFV